MTAQVIGLVLFAALCHATWNALVKSGKDKLVAQAYIVGAPVLVCLPILFFVEPPAPESWLHLGLSILIHQVYFATLVLAYRYGDLSQVYPVSRGLAPVLVAGAAWIIAGESITTKGLIGLAMLSFAIISLSRLLNFTTRAAIRREGEAHSLFFALATAMMIAAYSLVDGLGARASGSAFGYICWLLFLEGIPFLLFALWRRRGRIVETFGPMAKPGIAGGLLSGVAYAIAIWAMTLAPLAQVVALRETSVIIAAFIGTRLLGEPFGKSRILAASLVAGGVALMHAAG